MDNNRIIVFGVDLWLGTPRMPKALKEAGFEVATICLRDSMLSKTSHADYHYILPDLNGTTVAKTFTRAMKDWQPVMVVIGDETVLKFLHKALRAIESGMDIGLDEDGKKAVRNSLPLPQHLEATIDKFEFRRLLKQLDVRCPRSQDVLSTADALSMAEEVGYPVVVKSGVGAGGTGVAICRDEDSLADIYRRAVKMVRDLKHGTGHITVEEFVPGERCSMASVSFHGELLMATASEKVECYPPDTGPSTVRRFFDIPEVYEFASRVIQKTRFNGFCGMDFIVHKESRLPYMIEWNARLTPHMNLGKFIKADYCQALYNRLNGLPLPKSQVEEGMMVALYPQELIRDRNSKWVQTIYHDVPRDDPELLAAFEAFIEESWRKRLKAEDSQA